MEKRGIQNLLPGYYQAALRHDHAVRCREVLCRLQADKLGATPRLHDQLAAVLAPRGGRKVPFETKARALAGIISREQEKIALVMRELSGRDVPAESIALNEFDISALQNGPPPAPPGNCDPARLQLYFSEAARQLFSGEIALIDREIAKFRPEDESERQARTVEAYITKNHTSAHARGVAGVCIAGDSPQEKDDPRDKMPPMFSQWSLPNYFQMVLRDPQTRRCEGLMLLHHYRDQGRRILTASFNPTSTYLFKVDEAELFAGIMQRLVEFAQDNEFDLIACSCDHQIRTNRTGGEFEAALERRIGVLRRRFTLSRPQIFSWRPMYQQQELDVLWARNGEEGKPTP